MSGSHPLRQPDFSGGELAPLAQGKTASPAYMAGLRLALNFICTLEGPILNRSGTRSTVKVKDSTYAPWLRPFTFTDGQTFELEIGDRYIRFIQNGAQVLSGGAPLEVVTPWLIADVWRLKFAQNAAVITFTHPKYQPQELAPLSNLNWTLTPVSTAVTPYFGGRPYLNNVQRGPGSALGAVIVAPKYDAGVTYFTGDWVLSGFDYFVSIQDFNLGNSPPTLVGWRRASWQPGGNFQKGEYAWAGQGGIVTNTGPGQLYIALSADHNEFPVNGP